MRHLAYERAPSDYITLLVLPLPSLADDLSLGTLLAKVGRL